jgi:hypothetical protein
MIVMEAVAVFVGSATDRARKLINVGLVSPGIAPNVPVVPLVWLIVTPAGAMTSHVTSAVGRPEPTEYPERLTLPIAVVGNVSITTFVTFADVIVADP